MCFDSSSMAVSMETQRLISVSLGKIAQSRGQRGGINLHKNLLVATVLHKARTAYMMESYSYQQHLHRQKLLEQFQQNNLLNPIQKVQEPNKGELCPLSRDSKMGHASFICEQSRAGVSSESATVLVSNEQMSVDDNDDVFIDKENSPPSCNDIVIVENVQNISPIKTTVEPDSHLVAASQLSLDASSCGSNSCKQQNLICAGTTCNVLKRRRVELNAPSQENDSPVNKVSRLTNDVPVTSISNSGNLDISHSDISDISHSSDSESSHTSESHQTTDTHQISSLVNIFNSGFSGLCVTTELEEVSCHNFQSDFDYSSPHQARKIPTKAG